MISKEQGVLWDNDPFALPKTSSTTSLVMTMVYGHMFSQGVERDSEEAKKASKDFPMSYGDWIDEKT